MSAKKSKGDKKLNDLFDKYADEDDPESMGMDGIAQICEELELDPNTDVRALVLPWKLGSDARPGCISREEFVDSMKKLRKDTVTGLKDLVPSLDTGFMERDEFRDFFKFAFKFSLEGTKRTLEKELVIDLLPIVVSTDRAPHLTHFLEFLTTSQHKVITMDQWTSFLQFSQTTRLDLSDFDEDSAWPVLLDEYVDWRKEQMGSS